MSETLDPAQLHQSLVLAAVGEGRSADVDGVVAMLRARVAAQPGFGAAERREVARILLVVGNHLGNGGAHDQAIAALDEAESILREIQDQSLLATCHHVRGLVLAAAGKRGGAGDSYAEAAAIHRRSGDHAALASALAGQVARLFDQGRAADALPLLDEQGAACRLAGDRRGLATHHNLRARALLALADGAGALREQLEEERLWSELGAEAELSQARSNRGFLLLTHGRLDEAEALLEERRRFCQSGEDSAGLANAFGGLALIAQSRGGLTQLTRALALHKEAENLTREASDADGLAKALALQAQILTQLERAAEAVPLAEEALEVAQGAGLAGMVAQVIRPILVQARVGAGERTDQQDYETLLGQLRQHVAAEAERQRQALDAWKKLPFWKRWSTPRPPSPAGF
jgi:tetratricopeptide (TPR) repeat protein